jgi:uncharacterized protein YdeI (YjbR/CyaY-like superfamily)
MTERDLPVVAFPSQDAWEGWLAEHHTTCAGVWLKIAKRGAGVTSVSYAEAVEVALCYGWIDGQKGALDEEYWRQRFTPRKPTSKWSRANREKALELISAGRMAPAGMHAVEAARADGRWDAAYASQSTATVPEDLRRALEASPAAARFFQTLDATNRYAILYRIQDAKKPDTRARRIARYLAMLEAGEKIYP